MYCKLEGENYDDQCSSFVEKFSNETNTSWISYNRYGNQNRYLFRKTFKCQHPKTNKLKNKRMKENMKTEAAISCVKLQLISNFKMLIEILRKMNLI